MKTNSTRNNELLKKLTAYTASAGALVALAPAVNGQIVYSGEENIIFEASPDVNPLDLDGDGIDDFLLGHNTLANTNTGTVYTVYAHIGMAAVNNARTDTYNSFLLGFSTDPGTSVVDGLASDEVVSSGQGPWAHSGSAGIMDVGYYVTAVAGTITLTTYFRYGHFGDGTNFMGIRFHIDGQLHYGWMRISIPHEMTPVTLVDWAYNSVPDEEITTGFVTPSFVNDEIYYGLSASIVINFDEPVEDLAIDDFIVDGGSITGLSVLTSGESYELEVHGDEEGVINISLPAGSVLSGSKVVLPAYTMLSMVTSVDLENLSDADIELFPNPATDLLNIGLNGKADVEILDLTGQLIRTYRDAETSVIDISELSSGVYHMKIISEGNILAVRKFIKQ